MMAIETCPATDHEHHDGANYYVTVIREGGEFRCIVGPFHTHGEALAMVDKANRVACEYDPRAHWYAFGTTAMQADYDTPGILNAQLGLTVQS